MVAEKNVPRLLILQCRDREGQLVLNGFIPKGCSRTYKKTCSLSRVSLELIVDIVIKY